MELFGKLLSFDSTSGSERPLADWLVANIQDEAEKRGASRPQLQFFEVGDGSLNILLSWGSPRLVYCSHCDTVPPYIAPEFLDDRVNGRGSCDAKGQIWAMFTACCRLSAAGKNGFGLLIVSGEETGSWGAKAFAKTDFKAEYLVIGEPTDNIPVSASKGTKSFDLKFTGEAFHSGYPQYGRSAVEEFVDFMVELEYADFPKCKILGDTTWNVGMLKSDNPQNILSPELTCRIYFRTTFASDAQVVRWMTEYDHPGLEVTARGGDSPAEYMVPQGFKGKPVAFGSDAPHLTNFEHRIICGPGTIKVAHRDNEHILLKDLEKAIENYINIFEAI